MKKKTLLLVLLTLVFNSTFSQKLDTKKLDRYFNALEKRKEAMGTIVISQNGKELYSKSIGYKNEENGKTINSDISSHYKIWSITKTYTAVMIFQLIEEEKLSLNTKLDVFFPQIPNSDRISIQHMLGHTSGIFDYINDTNEEVSFSSKLTKNEVADILAKFKPNFNPRQDFRYSNSNYLLLGYIIELLDDSSYEESLKKRISQRIHLKNTYFGKALKTLNNTAQTFQFEGKWELSKQESNYENHLQTADGGIVSSVSDMARFIEALFQGKLISKESLDNMLKGNDFYRLGIMKTMFQNKEGFGHTGGWISESSLFYYPEDQLTIAYVTNGIVIRKDEILDNVLKVYYRQPFAVSLDRNLHFLIISIIGILLFFVIKYKFKSLFSYQNLNYLSFLFFILFWVGIFLSGLFYNDYNHIKFELTNLHSFYSASGTFMASILLFCSLLFIPYIFWSYRICRELKINYIPLIPLLFVPISFIGSTLYPFPNQLYQIFANIIILIMLSPLMALCLWWKKNLYKVKLFSIVSLLLMILAIVAIMSRRQIPEFINGYFGLLQRIMYLGWTLWIVLLSFSLIKSLKNVRDSLS